MYSNVVFLHSNTFYISFKHNKNPYNNSNIIARVIMGQIKSVRIIKENSNKETR